MRRRTEDAKNRKVEEKARERERKREEKRLVTELMVEYKKKRDDLECDDLKELPKPTPVQCRSDRCCTLILHQNHASKCRENL